MQPCNINFKQGNYFAEIIDPTCHPEWDAFVDSHQHSWVCHTSEWLRAGKHLWKKLKPYYIVIRNNESKKICTGVPLCFSKTLTGKKILISPPFSTLIDPLTTNDESLDYFFSQLPYILNQENVFTLQIKTFKTSDIIPVSIFSRHDNHVHHAIDLSLNEDELMKSFNGSNVRNRIKKSLKSDLDTVYAKSFNELKQFYDLYVLNRKRLALPSIPWNFFEGIWLHLRDRDWVELLLTYYKGKMIGGLLNLKYRDRISAEVLAYKREFTHLCPNHLLFWTTITRAKSEGKLEFDLGRTPLNEKNLIKFKDHWGTHKTILPTFNYPKIMHGRDEKSNFALNLIRANIKHFPLPIYNMISLLYYSRPR